MDNGEGSGGHVFRRAWRTLLLLVCAAGLATAEGPSAKIGVLAKRGSQRCLDTWGPMAEYFTREIPGHSFTIVPLSVGDICPAVAIVLFAAYASRLNTRRGQSIQVEIRESAERKRAEETLQAERHHSASIIKGTNVGTWDWNVQTGETVSNETWAQIVAYTGAES